MRKSALEEFSPAPQSTLPWVASVALNFGSRKFHRGQEIPRDLLEASANFDRLVHGGYVRQTVVRPTPPPRPAPASAPAPPPPPSVIDHIAIAQIAIAKVASERGIPRRAAIDLVDQGIVRQAITAIGQTPRRVRTGAWGGGTALTQSGAGSPSIRRVTDDAYSILCAESAAGVTT